MKNIRYLFASLFILLNNVLLFAQNDNWEDDSQLPTPPIGEGARKSPIDMYEWMLMLVAISLIISYYLHKRNRRVTNN